MIFYLGELILVFVESIGSVWATLCGRLFISVHGLLRTSITVAIAVWLLLLVLTNFVVHAAVIPEVTSVHVALAVIHMISTRTTWLSI